MKRLVTLPLVILVIACATPPQTIETAPEPTPSAALAPAADIESRLARFPETVIDYDRSLLDANETKVVELLIEAAELIDEVFWRQVSEKNPEWRERLRQAARSSETHAKSLRLFEIMKGPWDRLDGKPFLANAGHKPDGAGFYPTDMSKEELEAWAASSPENAAALQDLFTVIRKRNGSVVAIPYSEHYRALLAPAAAKLREAAALTTNASLRDYLTRRADAFLSDDYFESDVAWMDLASPIEVVIGPYEVYEDALFNYKAAFETFLTAVDRGESEKLTRYAAALPAMERNLPIPDVHKNPNRGTESPIKVVQVIYTSGDARRGVQTAAFNLPNDEKVREAKGSKKVLLKNVMEAKFEKAGLPIARKVFDESQLPLVSFDAFFNQVLFHELSHGLGPGIITGPDGNRVEARLLLKETYSPIEEAKADTLGIYNLLWAMNEGLVDDFGARELFATNAALMFRSMRFGIDSAHGRANAVQWNWLREKGAIERSADGRFRVDFDKFRSANRELTSELLMIEATGDYERAKRLLDRYGRSTPEIESVTAQLEGIPVDIAPVYPAAGESIR